MTKESEDFDAWNARADRFDGFDRGDLDNNPEDEREAKNERPMTNIEFVNDLMEFCPTGALAQLLIIEAIARYADQVAAAPPMEHGLIDGNAWKRTAEYIKGKLDAKYGPRAVRCETGST